jgi:hypothetical protein
VTVRRTLRAVSVVASGVAKKRSVTSRHSDRAVLMAMAAVAVVDVDVDLDVDVVTEAATVVVAVVAVPPRSPLVFLPRFKQSHLPTCFCCNDCYVFYFLFIFLGVS